MQDKVKDKKTESIIECIKSGQGECCIGEECSLYERCWGTNFEN